MDYSLGRDQISKPIENVFDIIKLQRKTALGKNMQTLFLDDFSKLKKY